MTEQRDFKNENDNHILEHPDNVYEEMPEGEWRMNTETGVEEWWGTSMLLDERRKQRETDSQNASISHDVGLRGSKNSKEGESEG